MPKLNKPKPTSGIIRLSENELKSGISKINRRLKELIEFQKQGIDYDDGRVYAYYKKVKNTILQIFGEDSKEYSDFEYFSIESGNIAGQDHSFYQHHFLKIGIPHAIEKLNGQIDMMQEMVDDGVAQKHEDNGKPPIDDANVFIVHGLDDEAKLSVTRFIDKIGLNPIILHEQANEGKTIIEKFESHSNVGYAIILLTPDDEGKAHSSSEIENRARQNVIFEYGYFCGKLGRNKVSALYDESVTLPSDLGGLVYIKYSKDESWKLKLAQELKQAGLYVNANALLESI